MKMEAGENPELSRSRNRESKRNATGELEGAKTMNFSRNTCQHLGIHFTEYKVVLVSILGQVCLIFV